MFYYVPGNYVWSSAFTLALMAGGQLNQMDRWLAPLRDIGPEPDTDAWTKPWDSMGQEQSRHAAQERADGYVEAASARYFRAATYHLTGERQTRPCQDTQLHGAACPASDHAGPRPHLGGPRGDLGRGAGRSRVRDREPSRSATPRLCGRNPGRPHSVFAGLS